MAIDTSRVESLLEELTLSEKIHLLCGQGKCKSNGVDRLNVPVLEMSDGPNGLRGTGFFNPNRGCLLPCGTAMGATFDVDRMREVGQLLADEALCRKVAVVLAPVVCLQRSPLIGRGFEAFGEDPIMSGLMGAAYCQGLQDRGIAACIKHFFAHDQSAMSTEDNCIMTERTMREAHLLPFQLALKYGSPWSVMTSYNKVNGIHVSEDPKILREILRDDWNFDGLVMSDWWGTYSTAESLNAGMDLEMPGPPIWRGALLKKAVEVRKVRSHTVDESVRNLLNLIEKVTPAVSNAKYDITSNDTPDNRKFIRQISAESIVLLKNDNNILPLQPGQKVKFGLIGDHFKNAALSGGGSADVDPYYNVQPYDAFVEEVGADNIAYEVGCYSHGMSPLLRTECTQPESGEKGFTVEFFAENPETASDPKPIFATTTTKSQMIFMDSLPENIPASHYVRFQTVFTAPATTKWRFGLSTTTKAKLLHNNNIVIDQWSSHPPKKPTDITPCFNRMSAERFVDFDLTEGDKLEFTIILTNAGSEAPWGGATPAAVRIGGFPVLDEDQTIAAAVKLASSVDVPIIMTGLSSDYEQENADRSDLVLPGRCTELISKVLKANSDAIIVTQAGQAITMPWASKASTLVHSWLGGQECGHALTDVLFGRVNPAARLPMTFPKRVQDMPTYLTFGKQDHDIVYGEGVFIGYRYYEQVDVAPEFYFGHGLSYTKFTHSQLVVPAEFSSQIDHEMEVSVNVKNRGPLSGADVVQIYVSDPESRFQRPKKELKAFKKVWLEPGEEQVVSLKLDKYAISYWCSDRGSWKAEKGHFDVIVATSASPDAEVLRATFNLPKTFYWSGL